MSTFPVAGGVVVRTVASQLQNEECVNELCVCVCPIMD